MTRTDMAIPIRYLVHVVDDRAGPADLPLLAVTTARGVVRRSEITDDPPRAEDLSNYKRCEADDIVLNRMSAYQGALGIAGEAGLISPDYMVLRSHSVDPRFLAHVLRSPWGVAQMSARVRGIGSTENGAVRTPRINFADLGSIAPLVPSLLDQRRAADFLDTEFNRIATLSNRLSVCLERLREIARDRLASSLDAHAENGRAKLGWHWKVLSGYAFPSEGFRDADGGGVRLLRGINIGVGTIRWDETVRWPADDVQRFDAWRLNVGDLVLGMDRPWISDGLRIAELGEEDLPALLLQRVACLRPRTDALLRPYVRLWLEHTRFETEVSGDLTGVSVPHISPSQIASYRVAVPAMDDQLAVVQEARKRSDGITAYRAVANDMRGRLEEYRGALVTEVVRGEWAGTGTSDSLLDERAHRAREGAHA